MYLRLRFRLPENQIQKLLSFWEERRDKLSLPKEPNPPKILFPPEQLGTPDGKSLLLSSFEPIPGHFQTFVIGGRPGTTEGFPWNHGELYGVSISRSQNQVVYWANSW